MNAPRAAEAAGRMCPTDYRYPPSALNRAPDITADVLYVVGGLYGNLAALGEIERMAARERAPVTIVFNGDYHWFDAEPAFGVISRIATRPSPHAALYGLARDGVHIDALAVQYDLGAFLARFAKRWPEGSAADTSYHQRIVAGPSHTIEQARGERLAA